MDLGLSIKHSLKEIEDANLVLGTRSLSQEDLDLHTLRGPLQSQSITDRMRTVHHAIARMEVSGLKHVEIAGVTGYSQVTLSTLQHNPAYQELLSFYKEKADTAAFDLSERMVYVGSDALDRIHERILGDEPIPIKDLRQIFVDLADRTGHSPVNRSERVNYHLGLTREELEDIKNGSRRPDSTRQSNEVAEAPAPDCGSGVVGEEGTRPVALLSATAGNKSPGESLRAELREIPQAVVCL